MQDYWLLEARNAHNINASLYLQELNKIKINLIFSLQEALQTNSLLLSSQCATVPVEEEPQAKQCTCESSKWKGCGAANLTELREQSMAEPIKMGRRKLISRLNGQDSVKNDTKNIPKNYGKAILSFIIKSPKTKRLAATMNVKLPEFLTELKSKKSKINSIEGLRQLWRADGEPSKQKKLIRIMSYHFMRKQCLCYIFHSKVKNYGTHIKYRQKLIEGIRNPDSFYHIKEY